MGQPAAKQNDIIQATDTHIVMVPSPGGPVPTPTPGHPFNGMINGGLSTNVRINDDIGSVSQGSPAIATDEDGNVYLVWDDGGDPHQGDIFFSRSTDSGVTWSASTQVNDVAITKGSTPRSTNRVTAVEASLVCMVERTK